MQLINAPLHKPSLRLAGLYLAIIMVISLFFSVNVYQLSLQEFQRGFGGVPTRILKAVPSQSTISILEQQLIEEHEARYALAKQRVLSRLILTNVLIFIGGGFLSYYLARRTLTPIEEAHEAQSQFTADASHELRTPIAAMQSETEVTLMDPELTLAKATVQLKSNLEELNKLTILTEGLLRLARLENNELYQEVVDLDSVVQQALDRTLPLAEKKHILLTSSGVEGLQVRGDALSLAEAMIIILDNAIKYSPQKTEITIARSQDQRSVTVAIKDQGVGIKATEQQHIFDRFYRADTARSKQQTTGYGLGLAIAKNIVDAHGGRIAVSSKPGQGSTFTIYLPVHH